MDEQETCDDETGSDKAVKDVRRATRRVHSAEERVSIVLAGLSSEDRAWPRHRFKWPRDDCRTAALSLVDIATFLPL